MGLAPPHVICTVCVVSLLVWLVLDPGIWVYLFEAAWHSRNRNVSSAVHTQNFIHTFKNKYVSSKIAI